MDIGTLSKKCGRGSRRQAAPRGEEEGGLVAELLRELDHDRDPAFHVAGAETDDGAVFDPRDVALRGDGVEVTGEHDLRPPAVPSVSSSSHRRPDGVADIGRDLRLVPALGGMFTSSSVRSASRVARSGI